MQEIVRESADETTLGEMGLRQVLRHLGQAESRQRRIELLHTIAMGRGLGEEDQGACLKVVEQAAGVEVRRV